MDYEKKNKDAIKAIKQALRQLATNGIPVGNMIEAIKDIEEKYAESEDERIRKALLNHLKEASRGKTLLVNTLDYKRWADWLEKQGNKDEEILILKDQIESLHAAIKAIKETHRIELEKLSKNSMGISEATKQKLEDSLNKALEKETPESCNEFLENQGEQKPQRMVSAEAKEAMYNKPAWSEEDEKFVHGLIRGLSAKRDIHGHTTFSSDGIDITKTIDWLKSLKDRVQPQNKWKESLAIADLENSLCNIQDGFSDTSYEYRTLGEAIEFIRCTEPKPQWKPSDEQIKVCKEVYADILSAKGFDLGTVNGELNRMEEELKRLREE